MCVGGLERVVEVVEVRWEGFNMSSMSCLAIEWGEERYRHQDLSDRRRSGVGYSARRDLMRKPCCRKQGQSIIEI